MKNVIIFALTAMLMGGCDHSNKAKVTDPNAAPTQEFYGEKFDLANAIPVNMLAANLAGKDTLETTVEGVIDQTCPNAGCWLNIRMDNGELLKVTTDHVFFVPLNGCEGLKAKVKGKAYQYERSVEDQKHYAMEEGNSEEEIAKITEPLKLIAFTATGVMIEGLTDAADTGDHPASCNHDHKEGEAHDHEHEHGTEEGAAH
jgi:hypothetical protein